MVKFMKPGRVVLLLQGRHAGKKAVILSAHDSGSKAADKATGLTPNGLRPRAYPHAIVAGLERAPLRITKAMGAKRVAKRSKCKVFVKPVNYTHLMPTRYNLDVDLKAASVDGALAPAAKKSTKKVVKQVLEERYATGKNKWFFAKLRF
jgi:large subunit ribosomal protein L27e